MELFSEIYSCYYHIVSKILQEQNLTAESMRGIIEENGFSDTALYLMPKLTESDGWKLLEKHGNQFHSVLHHKPERPVSTLELRWLAALCHDPRFRLFFTDSERTALQKILAEIPPLFPYHAFCYYDQYLDGDPYHDEGYRQRFQLILEALQKKKTLAVVYQNKDGFQRKGLFYPLKIEYSEKDDKFRMYCGRSLQGNIRKYVTMNLGRIISCELSPLKLPHTFSIDAFREHQRCDEPVVIEVSQERNAIERVMIELSSYEKQSEYDEETGICTVRIYYYKSDETELLIRLLGFGPVLQVLSPPHFLEQVKDRVRKQTLLLQECESPNHRAGR